MRRLLPMMALGAAALLAGAALSGWPGVGGRLRWPTTHARVGRAAAVGTWAVHALAGIRLRASWRGVDRTVRRGGLPGYLVGQAERAARRADPFLMAGAAGLGLAILPVGGRLGHPFLAAAALAVNLGALAVATLSVAAMARVVREVEWSAADLGAGPKAHDDEPTSTHPGA